jgi:hypothetical protein
MHQTYGLRARDAKSLARLPAVSMLATLAAPHPMIDATFARFVTRKGKPFNLILA